MEMPKIPLSRRKFITNEPVQYRYLSLLVAAMLIPTVLSGACLYYIIFKLFSADANLSNTIGADLFPAIMQVNLIVLITFPVIFIIIFLLGISLSHKFAGPLKRLKHDIDAITESGNFNSRLGVRQHDDIKPLVDALNRLMDKVSEKIMK